MLALIPAVAAPPVGHPAPELAATMVDGRTLLLSQFRGKVVAVEFLHTTCPHCQHASALLERMYKEYGPRGFQPIGVAFNDMASMLVKDYIQQLGLTFPVGVATRDQVLAYLQIPVMERFFVPQMMFVDRKGVIRAYYPGGDKFFEPANEEANMRAQIETLLKEPAATSKGRAAAPHSSKARTAKAAKTS
jgi:peroxiredoxin